MGTGPVETGELRRVTVATRLFTPEPGAAAFRLGAVARALRDRGTGVRVLTTRLPPSVVGRPELDGVDVRRARVLRDEGGNVRGYVQYLSFDVPLLLRLLLGSRPQVVLAEPPPTTGLMVALTSALRRIPFVYYAADVSSTAAAGMGVSSLVVWPLRAVETRVMRRAARVLAVQPGVEAEVLSLGVHPSRVVMVGAGVDTTMFSPAPAADEDPADADAQPDAPPYLVYAGTMSETQGAGVFVEAFARVCDRHPGARLHMLGQGSERGELQALAGRIAPGRVEFAGVVPAGRVATLMRGAAAGLACLRPGRGYDFALPTKTFVATACGTPVIYTGVGPARDLVPAHDLGWSPDWDVEAIAGAMDEALSTPPTAERRAGLAAWTRENWSLDAVAARVADELAAVAHEHSASR